MDTVFSIIGKLSYDRKGLTSKEAELRINSSTIGMESDRRYTSETRTSKSYSVYMRKGSLAGNLADTFSNLSDQKLDEKDDPAKNKKNAQNDLMERYNQVRRPTSFSSTRQSNTLEDIRTRCVSYLLELLFGNKDKRESSASNLLTDSRGDANATFITVSAESEYYYKEEESTSFSAEGKVVTSDGREISFDMEISMSRKFEQYYSERYVVSQNVFCDPLVINLDHDIADVSDQKFFFDIDADGVEDEISELIRGSGYLALDKNGDGTINDGSELFGTKSGDGFKDLSAYDSDGNGWIDEADEIWSQLKIWTKDENGKDVLYSLSDKGVGSICLKNNATEFALTSKEDNEKNAMIRKTGIFLYENGNVGTMQHLDLAR